MIAGRGAEAATRSSPRPRFGSGNETNLIAKRGIREMADINVRELHPAIIGLMREMAYSRHPMTAKRKADFRVALIALLEFLYDEDGDVYVKKC